VFNCEMLSLLTFQFSGVALLALNQTGLEVLYIFAGSPSLKTLNTSLLFRALPKLQAHPKVKQTPAAMVNLECLR
jgi:hypothetical protein